MQTRRVQAVAHNQSTLLRFAGKAGKDATRPSASITQMLTRAWQYYVSNGMTSAAMPALPKLTSSFPRTHLTRNHRSHPATTTTSSTTATRRLDVDASSTYPTAPEHSLVPRERLETA